MKASPHGNPKAQRGRPVPPIAGRPALLTWFSFRIIEAGRRIRLTL